MLTRRNAILALLALPLGYFRAFGQSTLPTGKAVLTVDLNQWSAVRVTLNGKTTTVSAAEIFNALIKEEK